jgi:phage terminase Nu1 subunit (DNA packaging protein)
MSTEDDFEFEPEAPASDDPQQRTARGMVLNKSKLAEFTGLSPMTVDRCIADGAPIIGKGTRKQGWQINSAAFFGWYVRRKVEEQTDDPDAGNFDIAKTRDKEAQARLRELQIAEKEGELVPIADVEKWVAESYGVVRSRFLAVESQVPGLSDDQRDSLRTALADAFADVSGFSNENGVSDVDDDSEEGDSESASSD